MSGIDFLIYHHDEQILSYFNDEGVTEYKIVDIIGSEALGLQLYRLQNRKFLINTFDNMIIFLSVIN